MQSQHQRRYLRRSTRILHLEVLEDRHLLSTYTITDLGNLGIDNTVAYAINDSGMVVGQSGLSLSVRHGFLWDADNGMQDLGTLGGPFDSAAFGINSKGSLVGGASESGGHEHAFLSDGGSLVDLGTLGGSYSAARGLNNVGQVVGYSEIPSHFGQHAFVWDADNGMRDLGTFGGDSQARAINDSGIVVGFSFFSIGGPRAFRWDSDHGMQDLGTLGGDISGAAAINSQGHIVGAARRAGGFDVAFFYDGTQMIDIGEPSPSLSGAAAVNDSDQIVGTKRVQGVITSHGFVYADGQFQDLNDLIPPDSELVVTEANGINNAGQIVGVGRDRHGNNRHAILLTPDANGSRASALLRPLAGSAPAMNVVDAAVTPKAFVTPTRPMPGATPPAAETVWQATDVVFSGNKFSANRYVTAPLSLESDWLTLPE